MLTQIGALDLHAGDLQALAVALRPYLDQARQDSQWIDLDEYVALGFAPTTDAARKRIARGSMGKRGEDWDRHGKRLYVKVPK